MATKTLTVTVEAYEKLAAFKEGKESFSDVINKITRKSSLLDLVGVLSDTEANEMKRTIKTVNKRMRKRLENVSSELE